MLSNSGSPEAWHTWAGPKELVLKCSFAWTGPGQLGQEVSSQTAALLRNPWRKEKAASVRPVLEIYSASGMPLASLMVSALPASRLGLDRVLRPPEDSLWILPVPRSGRAGPWCPWAGRLRRSCSACRRTASCWCTGFTVTSGDTSAWAT